MQAHGRPDLAVPSHYVNAVSILGGIGGGNFTLWSDYLTGLYAHSVAIGDLNADGKLDLAVTNNGSNDVSALFNYGDGSFEVRNFAVGMGPTSVAIGDLNDDGKPDLAVTNASANTVSVLLGQGFGNFGERVDYGTGGSPNSVVTGDLNGDGKGDLVVANSSSNAVSVLVSGASSTTATSLAEFEVNPRDNDFEIRWSFGNPTEVSSTVLARATDPAGPWSPIAAELHIDGRVTVAIDRTATPGVTYLYRLEVKLVDGSVEIFAPVLAAGRTSVVESSVTLLAPNPTRGSAQIQYTVARTGRVRLALEDVVGRNVATLVDAIQSAGRYKVAWDGTDAGRIVPVGLYFVRLAAPDRNVVKRIATIR